MGPVMLHRALFGSLERFIGILIENYAGKFPFWISPLQTVVIPISEDFNDYAINVSNQIKQAGISSAVDLKNQNLNYKIRDHSLAKIPLLLVCGKKEVDTNSVTVRRLDSNKQENMELKKFLKTFSALNKASSNSVADFKQNYFQRRTKDRGPRTNNRISSPDVQVIASDGENLGVMNTNEAISMAKNQGLDLIEIAPNANPPVCKIMDIGKYKYDAQKKANLAKKKQKIISLKEIKMRPVTETHDYEFKVKNAKKFISKGDKVKFTIRFKGRELQHSHLGNELMTKIKDDMKDIGKVELHPKFDGKQMIMVIQPL